MLLTLVLVASIVGMLLLAPQTFLAADNKPSTWMFMGRALLASILSDDLK